MKSYFAEFIGTFFMVLFGCGSMVISQLFPGILNPILIPAVFGVSVATMIYTVGHISGAHFNPAVTIAFWASRNFPGVKVLKYILAQFTGAILASLFLYFIFMGKVQDYGTTTSQLDNIRLLAIESLISFVLMFVISSVATDARAEGEFAGLAIGMTVFLASAVFGPLTGASMNPARTLGPAIVSGNFQNLWIYFMAPIFGAIAGAIIYKKLKE